MMCNHDWIKCGDEKICLLCGQVVKEGEQGIDKFINQIIHGDCLEVMKEIPSGSIDMILCDLPYGITQCKWDAIIPFQPLWKQYERVIKDEGAIVLTAAQPFTSLLVVSNLEHFRYEWIWKKTRATGHLNAKIQPMREHESVVVFYKKPCTYNPQGLKPYGKITKRGHNGDNYNKSGTENYQKFTGYPRTVLEFPDDKDKSHPTQKPVALFEYLIKTYTKEGETVLDNCIGSGTTAVACINTGRNYIGIELDEQYVEIARRRINAVGE